nr:MAG TPA: hypothetical protein [Caudoviricetes sp.]
MKAKCTYKGKLGGVKQILRQSGEAPLLSITLYIISTVSIKDTN